MVNFVNLVLHFKAVKCCTAFLSILSLCDTHTYAHTHNIEDVRMLHKESKQKLIIFRKFLIFLWVSTGSLQYSSFLVIITQPVVNFVNILWTAFLPITFCPKNYKHKLSAQKSNTIFFTNCTCKMLVKLTEILPCLNLSFIRK